MHVVQSVVFRYVTKVCFDVVRSQRDGIQKRLLRVVPCNLRIDWQTLSSTHKSLVGMPLYPPKPCDCLWSIILLLLCSTVLELSVSCWRQAHNFRAHRSESSNLNTNWLDIQWSEGLIYRVMLLCRRKEISWWAKALSQWSQRDWWSSQALYTLR
jgi:hypothetical protein